MRSPMLWITVGLALVIAISGVYWGLSRLSRYQKDGRCTLVGLRSPVQVMRDEKGMAYVWYVWGQDTFDAIQAQGFVTAQDRLFQMQLAKLLCQGRISELIGDSGKPIDMRMRAIGMHRNAKKHAQILDDRTKVFFQRYVDGINAFINNCADQRPIEFKAAGIEPEPWAIRPSHRHKSIGNIRVIRPIQWLELSRQ